NRLSGCIWFHCASLGEFEQARPVIEQLKSRFDVKICLTFFSPSGYELKKNYNFADEVMYLPLDLPRNARLFIKSVKPSKAVFVKYELWLNYLNELNQKGIPAYLLSATFRPSHRYFKWYGKTFRHMLMQLDKIFVQDTRSGELLENI